MSWLVILAWGEKAGPIWVDVEGLFAHTPAPALLLMASYQHWSRPCKGAFPVFTWEVADPPESCP